MKNPRLFITGMGGMLGRALALLSLNESYEVGGTIHNNLPLELKTFTDQGLVKSYVVDLKDKGEIKKIVSDFAPDIVIHLAAKTIGRLDTKTSNPDIYTENLAIFKSVLSAVKSLKHSPGFVLGTSGCIVYDRLSTPDFITEAPVENLPEVDSRKEPYRAGRLEQEKVLVHESGVDYMIARPTQITGRGKFPRTVEYYIANGILEIQSGKRKDIRVRNKLGEVDILDVRDVARAYMTLIKKGKKGEIYHISSGLAITVEHLAKVFLEVVGLNADQFPVVSTAYEETNYFRFSPAKLKKLGWEPQFSLKDALSNYWEYFKKQERSKSYIL